MKKFDLSVFGTIVQNRDKSNIVDNHPVKLKNKHQKFRVFGDNSRDFLITCSICFLFACLKSQEMALRSPYSNKRLITKNEFPFKSGLLKSTSQKYFLRKDGNFINHILP